MRLIFLAEYQPVHSSSYYSSYILAHDENEASMWCAKRQLGETLNSLPQALTTRPTTILSRLDRQFEKLATYDNPVYKWHAEALLHSVMFCIDVATRSGRYRVPKDAYSDKGFLHELVHCLDRDGLGFALETPTLRSELTTLTDALPELFLTEEERLVLKATPR